MCRKPILDIRVSEDSIHRAYRILDAFIKTIEELGGSIVIDEQERYHNTLVQIRGEKMRVYLKEKDGLQLVIDDYDAERKNFRDTKTKTLESEIGKAIIELFETANRIRLDREKRAREEERKQQEAERQRITALRRDEEMARVSKLERKATDWYLARVIREYITRVETQLEGVRNDTLQTQDAEWLEWAKGKADWFDPLINRADPILGKRSRALTEDGNTKQESRCRFLGCKSED